MEEEYQEEVLRSIREQEAALGSAGGGRGAMTSVEGAERVAVNPAKARKTAGGQGQAPAMGAAADRSEEESETERSEGGTDAGGSAGSRSTGEEEEQEESGDGPDMTMLGG